MFLGGFPHDAHQHVNPNLNTLKTSDPVQASNIEGTPGPVFFGGNCVERINLLLNEHLPKPWHGVVKEFWELFSYGPL